MIPRSLQITAITKDDRHNMIDYAVSSINMCSGWITNHTMFSNAAICINFQMEAKGVNRLLKLLNNNGMNLSDKSIELEKIFLAELDDKDKHKEIFGAINITFVHNDSDLKIKVPNVPG